MLPSLQSRLTRLEAMLVRKTKNKLIVAKDEICSICFLPLMNLTHDGYEKLVTLSPCPHVFHKHCYVDKQNRVYDSVLHRCPECREPVSKIFEVDLQIKKIKPVVTKISEIEEIKSDWKLQRTKTFIKNTAHTKIVKNLLMLIETILKNLMKKKKKFDDQWPIEINSGPSHVDIVSEQPSNILYVVKMNVNRVGKVFVSYKIPTKVVEIKFYDMTERETYLFCGTLFGVEFEDGQANLGDVL